jgi:hypothetical protein
LVALKVGFPGVLYFEDYRSQGEDDPRKPHEPEIVLFVKFRVIRGSFLPELEQHEFQSEHRPSGT